MRHIIFLFLSLLTLFCTYFLLSAVIQSSIVTLLLFVLVGIIGFMIQKKIYQFFMVEFKFTYFGKEVIIPPAIKKIRDTGMEITFIFLLAAIGINPIIDAIDLKPPVFSLNSLYLELALTSAIIAIIPSLFYCYYFIWKTARLN